MFIRICSLQLIPVGSCKQRIQIGYVLIRNRSNNIIYPVRLVYPVWLRMPDQVTDPSLSLFNRRSQAFPSSQAALWIMHRTPYILLITCPMILMSVCARNSRHVSHALLMENSFARVTSAPRLWDASETKFSSVHRFRFGLCSTRKFCHFTTNTSLTWVCCQFLARYLTPTTPRQFSRWSD